MCQTVPLLGARPARSVVVVRAPDEVDLATAPVLLAALRERIAAAWPNVHVDMSDVTFMDCTAINTVLVARREAASHGLRVVIVRPSAAARRVLELARVTTLSAGSG